MKAIDRLLNEYGENHRNPVNKTIHWVCVPLIFFSIYGLIRTIPIPDVFTTVPYLNWASILLFFVLIYYIRLSLMLCIGFIVWGAFVVVANEYLNSLGNVYHLVASTAIFVLAWTGQFIGHKIEGKKPSFFKDLQFLLIGPAWLMHFIFKKSGVRYS